MKATSRCRMAFRNASLVNEKYLGEPFQQILFLSYSCEYVEIFLFLFKGFIVSSCSPQILTWRL